MLIQPNDAAVHVGDTIVSPQLNGVVTDIIFRMDDRHGEVWRIEVEGGATAWFTEYDRIEVIK